MNETPSGLRLRLHSSEDQPLTVVFEPTGMSYAVDPYAYLDVVVRQGPVHVGHTSTDIVIDSIHQVLVKEEDGVWRDVSTD